MIIVSGMGAGIEMAFSGNACMKITRLTNFKHAIVRWYSSLSELAIHILLTLSTSHGKHKSFQSL